MGQVSMQGFASMDSVLRSHYASIGGRKSSANFANDPEAIIGGGIGPANQPLAAKTLGGQNSHCGRLLS